jgi:hypothetical protein
MSITNSNFNQRSILGLHRDKVFTSTDTLSNSQLTVPFLQQNLGNVVTSNDESFNYNPSTQTLSVENISSTVIGGSTSIAITETTDDTYYYVTFVDSSGSEKILRANTSGISYNPDKDELQVSDIIGAGNCDFLTFSGDGNGLTNLRSSELDNDSITIGTSNIALGSSSTTLLGLTSIGIGTSSPDAPLHVRGIVDGSSYTYGILIGEDTANGNQRIKFNCSGGSYAILDFGKLGGVSKCSIEADVNLGEFRFYTGGSGIAAMKIDQNNNVGIGTTSPSKKLTILTNSDYSEFNLRSNSQEMLFGCQTSGTRCYIQARTIAQVNNYLTLNPNGGNVAIGIATPLSKLHVEGDICHPRESWVWFSNSYTDSDIYGQHGIYQTGDKLRFWWRNQFTNNFPITIDGPNGRVGINNSNPTYKFDIDNSGGAVEEMRIKGSDPDIYLEGTAGTFRLGTNGGGSGTSGGQAYIYDHTTDQYVMTFQRGSGNVGIGTSTPAYKLDIDSGASTYAIRFRNNLDTDGWLFRNTANNIFAIHQEGVGDRMTFDNGSVGIGMLPSPEYKLDVAGQLRCGNPANNLTALDIEINSDFAYGIYIGGWSYGGRLDGNAAIETSGNLHIDSPSDGPDGPGNLYLNYYNEGQSTYIRNRVDISDRRIKKDIVEIETEQQFNETFDLIKKVGSYKYKYRDTYKENDLDQYGFLAQEVQEHYPVACKSAGTNLYLPNIMQTLDFTYEVGKENQYTFTIEGYDLDVDIKYLFYGFRENVERFDYMENINPTSNNTFIYTPTIIKNQEQPTYIKLVLVGTYTNDKLAVSKDRLFQLGFTGVRGLIKENETLKDRIKVLEENQKKIINKLNTLIDPSGWFQNSI